MEKRQLGNTGFSISVVGIGCARLGSINNPVSTRSLREVLAAALDLGVTLFDTANVYGQGDSERILGAVVRSNRNAVVVTKVGKRFSAKVEYLRPAKPMIRMAARIAPSIRNFFPERRSQEVRRDFAPRAIISSVESSLGRLGMDEVHAVLLHDPSADELVSKEVIGALEVLRTQGKIAMFGASVATSVQIDAILDAGCYQIVQIPFSLAAKLAKSDKLASLRGRGIGIIVRELLRPHNDVDPRRRLIGEELQSALAHDEICSAIVGISTLAHLNELVRARG